MTLKKVAVKPKKRVSTNLWKCIKDFLLVENKFTEGQIHDMVDYWNQRKVTEEAIKNLTEGNTHKLQTIAIKDNIISDLTNEIAGKEETCKHHKDFQDKLSMILNCTSEQGDILASAVTAVGNESKLNSCLIEKSNLLSNLASRVEEEVDKRTFELRVKVASQTMEMDSLHKDAVIYQKKIDQLMLGRVMARKPLFMRVRRFLYSIGRFIFSFRVV